MERVANNRKLFKELLFSFYKKNQNVIQNIKEEIKNGNISEASRIAHTLKSVSGNIGAQRVYLASADVELALNKNGNYNEKIDILEEKLQRLLKSLKSFVEEDKEKETLSEENIQINYENLTKIIGKLKEYLIDNNTEAIDIFNDFKSNLPKEERKKIVKIEEFINDLEFNSALEELEKITKEIEKKYGGRKDE